MKNKNKITSSLKLRQGLLVNWSCQPQFNYISQHKSFQIIRHWLVVLNDIPLNYLLYNQLKFLWKQRRYFLYLKYRYLKKNILNQKKKLFLFKKWTKLKKKNVNLRNAKFWRPKFVPTSQLGKIDFKWLQTGLQLNVPVFFLPIRVRLHLRKNFKKKKKLFIKKSKIQILKLFLMKLILDRKLKKLFSFPITLNFRYLTLTSKKELRLQSNQLIVYKDFFFYKRDRLFRRTISALTFGFYYCHSQLIAQQIAIRLTRSRKHFRTIYHLKQTLHYLRLISPETRSYQIDIYGKIGANTRTSFFRMTSGKAIKLQKLATKIHYTYQECFTFTGVFGIHVWLVATI